MLNTLPKILMYLLLTSYTSVSPLVADEIKNQKIIQLERLLKVYIEENKMLKDKLRVLEASPNTIAEGERTQEDNLQCKDSPSVCSKEEICKLATSQSINSKRIWKSGSFQKFVDEAKRQELDCGVSIFYDPATEITKKIVDELKVTEEKVAEEAQIASKEEVKRIAEKEAGVQLPLGYDPKKLRKDFAQHILQERYAIQRFLRQYGYKANIDGLFGKATSEAVKKYMIQNGINNYQKDILRKILNEHRAGYKPTKSSSEKIYDYSVKPYPSIPPKIGYTHWGAAALADLDNDGKAEIVMSRMDNNYSDYVWGSKKNQKKSHRWIEAQKFYDFLSILQVTDLSNSSIVTSSNKFKIFGDKYTCLQASHIVTGDLNNDGIDDVAIGCSGFDAKPWPGDEQFVLLSKGNKRFELKKISKKIIFAHGITMFDVDSDGDLDLLYTSGGRSSVYVAYNDGIGNFTDLKVFMRNMPVNNLAAIDVNDDGLDDLLISGNERGTIPFRTRIYWNDGTGYFSASNSSSLPLVSAFSRPLSFIADDKYLYIRRTNNRWKNTLVQRIEKSTLKEKGRIVLKGPMPSKSLRVEKLGNGVYKYGSVETEFSRLVFKTDDPRFK